MWFETLTGFREESPSLVRDNILVEGEYMRSKVNGRRMECGHLESPCLGELRNRIRESKPPMGTLTVSEVVANVQHLHCDPENRNALFQVASPFNVSQVYCSALPVRYSALVRELWTEFAKLILEAAYEATFCVALINLQENGSNKLFLTLLGGGAFGNHDNWIMAAMERAISLFADTPLEVAIVSHGDTKPSVRALVERFR